jgi:hypothetical protein
MAEETDHTRASTMVIQRFLKEIAMSYNNNDFKYSNQNWNGDVNERREQLFEQSRSYADK